jgi:very-long-chain enoyl-CoA reductase
LLPGPQISWRTVFVIEYLGPILFHVAALALRTTIYSSAPATMSPTQKLTAFMFISHFIKREIETLFIHKFSASTMPVSNIFRNSFFYWVFAGLLCALSIYHPSSLAARADRPIIDYIGLAIFLFGEVSNASVHLYLSSLRSPGGTERKIPHGYGFSIVTCPNYMFEVISWLGVILASRDWSVVFFISFGMYYMYTWGVGKERAYRKEFGSKYKAKRYVMLPGLL